MIEQIKHLGDLQKSKSMFNETVLTPTGFLKIAINREKLHAY